jgi:hypothetical protein
MKNLLVMIGATAFAVCLLSPAMLNAAVSPLQVSVSGDEVSVSVLENALDDTSKLYLVWDDADRGESLKNWPAENRIAYSGDTAISSAAATYKFNKAGAPENVYLRVIATSDVRLIDGYVKLGANQYVNTGVKDTSAYGLEIRYRPTGTSSGSYSSLMGGVHDKFTIGINNSNYNKYYIRYADGTEVGNPAYTLPNTTEPHSVRIFKQKLFIDGKSTTTPKSIPSGAVGSAGVQILLGVTWDKTNYSTGALRGKYCHAEWYYAMLLDANGNALVNLVPALRGNAASPEAVFYDTVSGTCFSNAGTGALAYSGSVTNAVAFSAAVSESLYNGRVAKWTGAGDPMNAKDPRNWQISQWGEPLEDVIPERGTLIGGCTLSADADWSALAATDTWVQPVEYIDVVKGVYLDTEFCPDSNTRVVMDVTVRNITLDKPYPFRLFAVYTNSWKNGAFCLGNDERGLFSSFGNSGGTDHDTATWIPVGRHKVDYNKGVVWVDGIKKKTRTGAFVLDKALYLFLTNNKGAADATNAEPFRFHSCQIYDNGTLVRDYVPVTVGGAVKMYDRKNGSVVEFGRKSGNEQILAGGASDGYIAGGSVKIGGDIDLAGHRLTVGDLTGSGTITDSVGGGELHVTAERNFGFRNTGISMTGKLKLIKDGEGVFVGAKSAQTYMGGTLVSEGRLKRGVNDRPFGEQGALITVEDGAAFDWAGGWTESDTSTAYDFTIEGEGPDGSGAIVNTVFSMPWNIGAIADLELMGDARIGGFGGWGFSYVNNTADQMHVITMNGHTLKIWLRTTSNTTDNSGVFYFRNVKTLGSGTIAFVDCESTGTWLYPSFFGSVASDLSSVAFDFGEGYCINVEKPVTVGTFIDRRTYGSQKFDARDDRRANPITVLDAFKPMTTNLVRTVALGDATHLAPVIDLSAIDAPFVLPASGYSISMAEGATVKIRLGTRKTSSATPIITWENEKPSWVDSLRFVNGDEVRRYGISVRDDGIYVVDGFLIIVR